MSGPTSFIANAHNELNAFYTGFSDFLRKNYEANRGEGRPYRPLWIRHCISVYTGWPKKV